MIYVIVLLIIILKLTSIFLLANGKKLGLALFFIMSGISSSFMGYISLGFGSLASLEWLTEVILMLFLVYLLVLKNDFKLKKITNDLPLFFLLIFIFYLFNIRFLNAHMLNAIFISVYPVVLYLLLRHSKIKFNINQKTIMTFIFFSVFTTIIYSIFCHLLFNVEIISFREALIRFRGSLGASSYAIYLLPFALYFIVLKKYISFVPIFILMLATGSRMVTFTALIILLFNFLIKDKKIFNFRTIMATLAVFFLGFMYYQQIIDYITTHDSGRLRLWSIAIKDAFPNLRSFIIGKGAGYTKHIVHDVMPQYLGTFSDIHSDILRLIIDNGLICAIIIFFIFPILNLIRNKNKFSTYSYRYSLYSIIALILISITDNILMYLFSIKLFIVLYYALKVDDERKSCLNN